MFQFVSFFAFLFYWFFCGLVVLLTCLDGCSETKKVSGWEMFLIKISEIDCFFLSSHRNLGISVLKFLSNVRRYFCISLIGLEIFNIDFLVVHKSNFLEVTTHKLSVFAWEDKPIVNCIFFLPHFYLFQIDFVVK